MTRSVEIPDAAVTAARHAFVNAPVEADAIRAAVVAARPYLMPTAEEIAMKLSLVRFSDEESDRMIELTMREAWPLADAVLALLNGGES